ncbi:hypothetical protein LWI28_010485 [Acer negundo]|uniref:Aldehyde dehydrogenase domain-containing protein n=1 Tax=Acer negundo TaxID=4023 RepID=A0AAD5JMT6_ACENE|nr:hypothetical protein LWI28_010485 [Acer negundo]
MAFWWSLIVLALAYAICRFLLMLIPPNVPSIDVDASDMVDDGNQSQENSFIYIPPRGRTQQSDKKVQCYEPATMKYLGFSLALSADEVKERVALARKAQKVWAKSSFKQRRQFLRILLKYIIEHQELICEISSRDTGKTMVDASLGEIMTTCEKITWLLSEGEKWLKPEYRSSGRSMFYKKAKVEFHPLVLSVPLFHGIILSIISLIQCWQQCFQGMALSLRFQKMQVGLGVSTYELFKQLLLPLVLLIVWLMYNRIMKNASETLTPVTLELGGKDAFIVCDDVDVPHVAQIAVRASLQSSGQNCAGAERFYVHRDVYSSFVSEVAKIVKSVLAGPPLAGKYDMGAICLLEHSDKLQYLVNDAIDKGAEILARGSFGHLGEDAVDQYFPPTVIVNVNHSMKLMQEETFGPLMPIMKFNTDEEAIKLANDSRYGLGCAVFSGSQRRAKDIASQINCGVAAINDFASNYMCQSLPFGGVKDSGFGRFAGVEGLRACCLVKSVVEDRWWPYIKTKIPKPIQYPVAENAFEFQQSLVETLYG